MGIATGNFFVSKKLRSTLDDFIDHIAHVADLVGIDYVGIGTRRSWGRFRVRRRCLRAPPADCMLGTPETVVTSEAGRNGRHAIRGENP